MRNDRRGAKLKTNCRIEVGVGRFELAGCSGKINKNEKNLGVLLMLKILEYQFVLQNPAYWNRTSFPSQKNNKMMIVSCVT